MFSVVTPRIWVSPRSNSAEPCTRGSTSTSADSGPDVGEATAVDADLVAQDPLADQLLGHRAERGADLLLAAGELLGELAVGEFVLDRVECGPRAPACRRSSAPAPPSSEAALDRGVGVVLVVQEDRELDGLLGRHGELGLRLAQLPDERLGGLEALGHDLLGRGRGACPRS
jgi:hypothetical protein